MSSTGADEPASAGLTATMAEGLRLAVDAYRNRNSYTPPPAIIPRWFWDMLVDDKGREGATEFVDEATAAWGFTSWELADA